MPPAGGIGAGVEIGNAGIRQFVGLQMVVAERQAGRAVEAQLDRRRNAPALGPDGIPARHVLIVPHGGDPDPDVLAERLVDVDGRALVVIGAEAAAGGDETIR